MNKVRGGVLADFIVANLLAILLFLAVAFVFVTGINNATRSSAEEEKRIAEQSVRRAVVSCYAIEGFYPDSYDYLRTHYSVRVDEDKYMVIYDIFASNIMPDITIIEVEQ